VFLTFCTLQAGPPKWGFTSDDRNCMKAFVRRSAKLSYQANSSVTFASFYDDADNKLFAQITGNIHLLHPLLPSECEQHYSLHNQSHNFQLSKPETTVHQSAMTKTLSWACSILTFLYQHGLFSASVKSFLLCNSIWSVLSKLRMNEWCFGVIGNVRKISCNTCLLMQWLSKSSCWYGIKYRS